MIFVIVNFLKLSNLEIFILQSGQKKYNTIGRYQCQVKQRNIFMQSGEKGNY